MTMILVCKTERLIIRHFSLNDAEFILKLLNQPSFIENLSDKGIRRRSEAVDYLNSGPIASYRGFGRELINRDELDDIDIGHALLPNYCSKGYAIEACKAVISRAENKIGLKRIAAITKSSNKASVNLLKKILFKYKKGFLFMMEKIYISTLISN